MELTDDACYQLLLARDARYDGRLFFGVRTTGIFCRPICTAKKPRRENVTVYTSAAGAAAAGFRPCLRCRPEASPGTPAWGGTEVTVRRALRLIADGGLDDEGIGPFAARVGVGPRHLRRLFQQHVGAPPIAVARMRRVLFAKRLIDETGLPLTRVALSAGFGSVRRFNAEIRDVYREAPTALRARTRHPASGRSAGEFRLALAARPPFDWPGLYAFLAPRATPGVEHLVGGIYRRTFTKDGAPAVMEIEERRDQPGITLTLRTEDSRGLIHIVERVRRMFDLDADPLTISDHLRRDQDLRPLVDRCPGRRVPGAWDPFELAVRAVLGQQVTVKGATTLTGRLVHRFGEPIEVAGAPGLDRLFPRPGTLADADLSEVGIPASRQETLRALARAFQEGALPGTADREEERIARWCRIQGIGPWTAHYVAMRAFGDPDSFPDGDLALRKALGQVSRRTFGKESLGKEILGEKVRQASRVDPESAMPTAKELRRRSDDWRPWRAYAAIHLWASL